MANDDFLVPTPRPFIEASIEIAEQPAPRRGSCQLGLERLPQLPSEQIMVDLHCVTHWSKLGTTWEGVSRDTLLADMETSAGFALAASYGGYTTNLPLEDLTEGKAWIAFGYDGQELEPEHGGPARLLVPHLYLWKSAKWIHGIQLGDQNEPGFWESLGYHSYGDPWREQRFWGD